MSSRPALHLVACVKTKAPHAAPAADLYRSPLFMKMRAYVQAQGGPWYILSALHGLVEPSQVIEPYEQTLLRMSALERRHWGSMVIRQLINRGHGGNGQIVILAGMK